MNEDSFSYLVDPAAIKAAVAKIPSGGPIAVDVEAAGLYRYRDEVCLIQIASKGEVYLIDALAQWADYSGLAEIFKDPYTAKVFHGCDYDIRLLKRQYGFAVTPVFDTMIAAQFLGKKAFGLAALLLEEFGIEADKKYQKADWSARPLDAGMLAYAALDVIHLCELASRLERELEKLGRLGWAKEEFRLLELAEPSPPAPPCALDFKGAGKFTPRQSAVLQALLEVRDETAREWDRPPFKVLSGDLLLGWAQNPPKNKKEIFEAKGASPKVIAKLSDKILASVNAALALPPEKCPRRESLEKLAPLTDAQKARLAKLKEARAKRAEALSMDPGFIINTATLEKIARAQNAPEFLDKILKNWQREA
ncbi:ribonuclease D, partial [bacterium]